MTILKTIAIAATAALLAGAASAATLSLGGTTGGQNLNSTGSAFDLDNKYAGYSALTGGRGLDGDAITFITGNKKTLANGLSVSARALVTYTYLGFEAANSNYSLSAGGASFFNKAAGGNGATAFGATTMAEQTAGLIKFAFGTSAPNNNVSLFDNAGLAVPGSKNYAIGYSAIFNDGKSVLVFFDDIAAGDRDFDDMAMRIDVSAVPIPAAGFLMLGAMGALGVTRRRKKA